MDDDRITELAYQLNNLAQQVAVVTARLAKLESQAQPPTHQMLAAEYAKAMAAAQARYATKGGASLPDRASNEAVD